MKVTSLQIKEIRIKLKNHAFGNWIIFILLFDNKNNFTLEHHSMKFWAKMLLYIKLEN